MKKIKTYSIILICTVLLFNCKKYPEGGCERRGPKNIIGDWKLSLYEVNGIDSTDLINFNGNDEYKIVKIYKNASVLQIDQKSSIGNSASLVGNNEKLKINGEPINNGQKCILDGGIDYCFRLFFTPESGKIEWVIQKLTKNEMILSCDLRNKYILKFTQ